MPLVSLKPKTERVVLFVTVAQLAPDGEWLEKMLAVCGHHHACRIYPCYREFIGELEKEFGEAERYAGTGRAAIQTMSYIGDPQYAHFDTLLDPTVNFPTYMKGEWMRQVRRHRPRGALKRHYLFQFMLDNPGITNDQALVLEGERLLDFALKPGPKFKLAVVYEPSLSLAMRDLLPRKELGMHPCEGVLLQLNGDIVAAEKVALPRGMNVEN